VAKKLCSIVGAHIDYCNSILYGAPTSTVLKLQHIQNSSAQVVLQQPKRSHAEPLLRTLRWLPVKKRRHCKLATLTLRNELHHCQTSWAIWFQQLLAPWGPECRCARRCLVGPTLLAVTSTRTALASRAFSVCAPVVWNSLPKFVQSYNCFKRSRVDWNFVIYSAF